MGILDIIGPVMVGPSSSHTAGAVRIGLFARRLLECAPQRALIQLHGSFAATGKGHGTHLALLAGLLGFAPDDGRIPEALTCAASAGLDYRFEEVDLGDVHPNSVHLQLDGDTDHLSVGASSVGGGRILVWEIDGFATALDGEFPTLLFAYPDRAGSIAVVSSVLADASLNIATMKVHRMARGGEALMAIQLDDTPSNDVMEALRRLPHLRQIHFIPALGFGG